MTGFSGEDAAKRPEPCKYLMEKPRQGWDEAFRVMAEHGDDQLLDEDLTGRTPWDKAEWEW
jgi:hypothetical protein